MSAPGNPNDRDYLDKGLESAQKKFGGQKFADPNKNRAMNEKITDFVRKQFEKITGLVCSCYLIHCRWGILRRRRDLPLTWYGGL